MSACYNFRIDSNLNGKASPEQPLPKRLLSRRVKSSSRFQVMLQNEEFHVVCFGELDSSHTFV